MKTIFNQNLFKSVKADIWSESRSLLYRYPFFDRSTNLLELCRCEMSEKRSSFSSSSDEPPNSRLFIIGSKSLTEEDFRNTFEEFGKIEEIWMVKDRQSGENKGVTYIKYSKTSEAARALEAMNGKCIGNINRNIKVMIAASREQGSKRDSNEEEKVQRLFVMVPKSMTDAELYEYFKAYGDIDYASIIRDRDTRESKGFAYVKYYKFSHAAAAFEQCDRKYKPVFAEPRKSHKNEERQFINHDSSFKSNSSLSIPEVHHSTEQYTKLTVIASAQVNQDQLWKLFDIVPGLDYCQLRYEGRPRPTRAIAEVVYTSPQWAAHAREKLHGFEYPIGNRLIVKPDYDGRVYTSPKIVEKINKPDIMQIAETLAQASNLIQAAGLNPDVLQAKLNLPQTSKTNGIVCNVKLPEPLPLAGADEETVARCFIVCSPNPPPNSVLRDVFCRFGNLIDVYMLNNRNCGYAKYSDKNSAFNAIQTLHLAEVDGVRLKVLEAEERPDYHRKRQRLDENP